MLTTNNNQDFSITASDSTVYVAPGVIQVGNYVMDYRGGSASFSELTNFDGSANQYQYSVLSIYNSYNFADMTGITSAMVGDPADLISPYIADTTTTKPIGLLLFQTDANTQISLISSSKVI
jgi:hypothetical protein